MRKAKIHFYIVSKTYLKYDNNNLTLSLRDIKDMKLKKIHVIPKQTQKQDDQPTAKELLTPYQAKVFRAKDKVILAWVKPKSQTYEGVRIFRSSYSQPHTRLVWGKELYDGTGIQGILICEVSAISLGVGSSTDTLAPPPPKIPRHRDPSAPLLPKAPTGLRLEGVFQHVLNGYKGQLMPFYEDREVTSGNSYVYTLVAYGNNGQYSYPVEAVIRYEPTRNEPTVDSFSEYQNNLKVLQALKQFYIDNKNTINADQIQSAISEIEKKQTPTTKP
jgi:hypothetical protein